MDKTPYDVRNFINDIKDNVTEEDFEVIKAYLYRFDNENLVNILEKKDEFVDYGIFTKEELEEEVKIPERIPEYMKEFLDEYKLESGQSSKLLIEDRLSTYYYNFILENPNEYVKEYFHFENNMKNVLAALNCRKYGYEHEKNVLMLNEDSQSLLHSTASDFGLSTFYPWLQDVIRIYNESTVLDMEKKLDQLRFELTDSMLTFEYFNIGSVLGYFIKLVMVNRWIELDEEKGTQIFEDMTQKLVGEVDLSQE